MNKKTILKEISKIIFYLLGTAFLAALLAPPIFWMVYGFSTDGTLPLIGEIEFQKVFNRAVLIAAVILLWPTIKWLEIRDWSMLGLKRHPHCWRHLGIGFIASFFLILALGVILLQMGVYRLKADLPWSALIKIACSAIVVSLIEEFLFRGALLGLFLRAGGKYSALLAVSALFSIVHFLKPKEAVISPESVTWFSGFQLIPQAFWQFGEPLLLLSGFITLFCVGWILGYATLKTKSLCMAIGLHAGWIFGTMGFSKFTKRIIKDTLPWLGSDLSVGLVSVFVVLLTGGIVWCYLNYAKSSTPKSAI